MRLISAGIRIVAALAIAALALPVAGQNVKYFTLGAPSSISVTTTTVEVTFKNVENGNSTFNAVSVEALPSAGATVAISAASGTPGGPGGYVQLAGNKIALVGLSPTKKGDTLTVTLTVQVTGAGCGGYVDWKGGAWTGSPSSPSTPFVQKNANPRSTIATSCTMSFQTEPKDALTNTTITGNAWDPAYVPVVEVKLMQGSSPAAGESVQLQQSGACAANSLSLANATAVTGADGVAKFTGLKSTTSAKGCRLVAKATGYPDANMQAGNTFSVLTPTLAFVYEPSNALSGVTITNTPFNNPAGSFVTVKLLVDGVAPPSGFPATEIQVTSACTVVSGDKETTDGSGSAVFDALKITNGAAQTGCTLTANALGVQKTSTSTFGIAPFNPEGVLGCNETADPSYVTFPASLPDTEPGYVLLERGPYNTKGDMPCVEVDFEFTNKIVLTTDGEDTVILKWDTVSQPNAAFRTTINWSAQMIPAGGYPTVRRPSLAWEFNGDGSPIEAKITEGLACLSPYLPAPYGKLTAALDAVATTATIDLTAVSPDVYLAMPEGIPVPAYIGYERIVATRTGTSLALVRGQATTTATAHSAGAYVMSTPMPVDTRSGSPYNGKAVRMCLQSHGWSSYGSGMYYEKSQVIDTGDGWVSFR